jgi:hypothetical protein
MIIRPNVAAGQEEMKADLEAMEAYQEKMGGLSIKDGGHEKVWQGRNESHAED